MESFDIEVLSALAQSSGSDGGGVVVAQEATTTSTTTKPTTIVSSDMPTAPLPPFSDKGLVVGEGGTASLLGGGSSGGGQQQQEVVLPTSPRSMTSIDDIVNVLGMSISSSNSGIRSPMWERVALEAGEGEDLIHPQRGGDLTHPTQESISEADSSSLSGLISSELLQASVGPVRTITTTTSTTIATTSSSTRGGGVSSSLVNMSMDSLVEQPLEEAVVVGDDDGQVK